MSIDPSDTRPSEPAVLDHREDLRIRCESDQRQSLEVSEVDRSAPASAAQRQLSEDRGMGHHEGRLEQIR